MPNVRRIKSVKWDEDDLDDYYSDDYSDYDDENPDKFKISNKSRQLPKQVNLPIRQSNTKSSESKLKCNLTCSKKDLNYKNSTNDGKPNRYPLNVVVLGAVDAGKSTLLGHFLSLTNCVDKKLKNLKHLSWILDQGEDERDRGITIDPTKCQFNLSLTNNRVNGTKEIYDYIKVNVIDTPGHHDLIQNLVMGSIFANSAIIIVDSNDVLKSEIFSSYFSEHILLLYFLGIRYVTVCINKIDRFNYSEEVYNKVMAVIGKLVRPYENSVKFTFLPVSGLNGDNLITKSENITWFKGPTLIESLQAVSLDIVKRPVVIYDKVICHVFDLWESGKNVCCSCFVEGNILKPPMEMYTLPNCVDVKCVSKSYQTLNLVPTSSSSNVPLSNDSDYVNDFVDCVEMKGDISNLAFSKLLVDPNTYSRIKNNTSSIVKTSSFFGFVYLNRLNKLRLTIGQNVELYVGYSKQSANIKSIFLVDNLNKMSTKNVYSLLPGQFSFVEFVCYSPILVEPMSRSCNFIRDIIGQFGTKGGKTEGVEHASILSRVLVRSSGYFIAGGIAVAD